MKTMNRLLILAGIAFLIASCGNSQTNEVKADNATATEYGAAKVEVYYFHATRRCQTCNKIEDVSKDFVNSNYKDADLKYYSINFEENQNKEIAKKYNVAWSSLYIASGDSYEDLTDLAFQVINTNPEQLTDRIKSIIDGYLNIE
jgi:predicted membrane-bound dolichyl-phosphate-mannose-protein mannosyltransferase